MTLQNSFRYRLGIDVGVASLGICILELKTNKNESGDPDYHIKEGCVGTWVIPEGAEERRLKRGARRTLDQKNRRLDRLSDLLSENGIGYPRNAMPKDILDLSPITCRAKASREKVGPEHLARAILHIAKHRGSSAFLESDIKEDKEKRETAEGITRLKSQIFQNLWPVSSLA